jgi:hypothetical protein
VRLKCKKGLARLKKGNRSLILVQRHGMMKGVKIKLSAAWPSGKAGACKALTPSSNLGAAFKNRSGVLCAFVAPARLWQSLLQPY